MKTWNAFLRGEDRTEFTIEVEAETIEAAEREIEELYPEASVIEIFDPEQRADEIYDRAQRDYDEDRDNYDY